MKNIPSNFKKIIDATRAKISCSAFGVVNSLKPVISNFCSQNIIYVVSDYIAATKYKEYFDSLGTSNFIFTSNPDSFIYKKSQSNTNTIGRNNAFFNIFTKKANVIIATADSLLSPCANPKDFLENIISLKVGQSIEPEVLVQKLNQIGYKKTDIIAEAGQFSSRGEVVDIFASNNDFGVRIDYFDDQIESISMLSTENKVTKQLQSIKICPFTNIFLDNTKSENIIKRLEKLRTKEFSSPDDSVVFNAQIDDIITRLETQNTNNLDVVMGYIDKPYSIFDYLIYSQKDYVCFIDESKLIYDVLDSQDKENTIRLKELDSSGMLIAERKNAVISKEKILQDIKNITTVVFQKITNANRFFEPKLVVDFNSKPVSKYIKDTSGLVKDLDLWQSRGQSVYMLAGKYCRQLYKNLSGEYFNFKVITPDALTDESAIVQSSYPNGFILPDDNIVVIGSADLFAKESDKKLTAARENVFSLPKVGDYVVHSVHGIGMCEGITQLTGSLGTKDYVVVRYFGGDKLYVPTTQMNLLDRFSGAETPKKLSKIGGSDFEKVKQKVKESVKKLAFNLVELYAKRESVKGFAFAEDNMLQKEFEKSFAYTETADQLAAIAEIKKDMQSTKVMDRLLCGDVGFGKTEVAMRAAFKAVVCNKQVAFLAPTTILSEQHFNTLKNRMQDFGVNVEVLNRFKTPKQAKDILSRLKQHKIDILCSTHRMLSGDVEFADLGLIILDEEQKFGVNDKEKLKTIHPRVDVLTLSATPIPRTLHMSLSGIRDISVISTPPQNRLPINTYVTEFSDALLRDAITREKNRGGQTFILYNKVESIYDFAKKVRDLVPDCNILVGHGQLSANLLEQVVYDFYSGKADVLICTTIMENGIDIENANTLIVCDADRFGLSQLYQLRGRVGRSNKMAYAYFTYQYSKVLTEEAYKRLDAISEFTEFGSGFKLAMRDLEIRGSGNVLGAEQHGFLQKVGYDMYSKLLANAVAEAKGEKVDYQTETQMKVDKDAYIPDDYITESEQRMIAYKNIATICTTEAFNNLKTELSNKFGELPLQVANLMEIAYCKNLAGKLKITEVFVNKATVYLAFEKAENITNSSAIGEAIYKFNKLCTLDLSNAKIKFTSLNISESNYNMVTEFIKFATSKLDN